MKYIKIGCILKFQLALVHVIEVLFKITSMLLLSKVYIGYTYTNIQDIVYTYTLLKQEIYDCTKKMRPNALNVKKVKL